MGQAEKETGPTLRFTYGAGRGRNRPDPTMDHRSGRLAFGGLTDNSGRGSNVIENFLHRWVRPGKKPARPLPSPMGQAGKATGPTPSFTDGSGRERNRPDPTMDHRSGRLPFGGLTDNSGRGSNVIKNFLHLWVRPGRQPARSKNH